MGSRVPFEVKGVVETFATEGAQVTLGVTVALHVTIEQPLQAENLCAESALEFGGI